MNALPAQTPHLFPHTVGRWTPRAVRAEGVWIWDEEGNRYLDADSGAISVISVGHGRAEIADAVRAQAATLAYVHNGQFSNPATDALAAALAEFAPADLEWSLFVSGGSEGNETAAKLARAYHLARGNEDKYIVVSRRRSYHGATLGALALSGIPIRSEPYAPMLPPQHKIDAVDRPLSRLDAAAQAEYARLAADQLEDAIEELGAERVSAFVAEPIVAAAAPAATPPDGYFERIREICDRHDVLLIADEVVTGFGRTGRNFGFQHWDALPDVVVSAKGLAGGYAPLGGVTMRAAVAETFFGSGRAFTNGLTYEANPVGCAAALAVLRVIREEGLVENAARQGEALAAGLRAIAARHPIVGDVRGRGLLLGVELVADPASLAPFPPQLGVTQLLRDRAQARGIMVYAGARTSAEVGDAVLVTPPLCIADEEVSFLLERFEQALVDVAEELERAGVEAPR